MDANSMFPSKYLKGSDIGNHRPTVKIESVSVEELGQDGEKESKPVVYFQGKEKGLVCNVTNWRTIIGLYGPNTENWIGQPITLSAVDVAFKGKVSLAIRVSSIKPAGGREADPHPKVENQHEPANQEEDEIPF